MAIPAETSLSGVEIGVLEENTHRFYYFIVIQV